MDMRSCSVGGFRGAFLRPSCLNADRGSGIDRVVHMARPAGAGWQQSVHGACERARSGAAATRRCRSPPDRTWTVFWRRVSIAARDRKGPACTNTTTPQPRRTLTATRKESFGAWCPSSHSSRTPARRSSPPRNTSNGTLSCWEWSQLRSRISRAHARPSLWTRAASSGSTARRSSSIRQQSPTTRPTSVYPSGRRASRCTSSKIRTASSPRAPHGILT